MKLGLFIHHLSPVSPNPVNHMVWENGSIFRPLAQLLTWHLVPVKQHCKNVTWSSLRCAASRVKGLSPLCVSSVRFESSEAGDASLCWTPATCSVALKSVWLQDRFAYCRWNNARTNRNKFCLGETAFWPLDQGGSNKWSRCVVFFTCTTWPINNWNQTLILVWLNWLCYSWIYISLTFLRLSSEYTNATSSFCY